MMWFVCTSAWSDSEVRNAVGVVSFSFGEASHQEGEAVFVGDHLFTGQDGILLVRFIDQANLSLRFSSSVQIESYHYDTEHPKENRVKYQINKGTVRSITGEAGHANKEGFRMNTPLVAIGVRGTDFITEVSESQTRVAVVSGGVNVSPLDIGCTVQGFGVCASSNGVELSAVSIANAVQAVKQGSEVRLNMIQWKPEMLPQHQHVKESDGFLPETDKGSDKLTAVIATRDQYAVDAADTSSRSVYWARWLSLTANNPQLISSDVLLNHGYLAVATNNALGLFIDPHLPSTAVSLSGRVTMKPEYAEVYYQKGDVLKQGIVGTALLGLNFSEKSFVTHLYTKENDQALVDYIKSTGYIDGTRFTSQKSADGVNVSGVVLQQGNQAAMLFEKNNLSSDSSITGGVIWKK